MTAYSVPLNAFPENCVACWIPDTRYGLEVDDSSEVYRWTDVVGGYTLTPGNLSFKPTYSATTRLITMGPGDWLRMLNGFPTVSQPFTVCLYIGIEDYASFAAIWTSNSIVRAYLYHDASNHAIWNVDGYGMVDPGYILGSGMVPLLFEIPSAGNFKVYRNGTEFNLGGHAAGGLDTRFILHASDASGSNSGNTITVGAVAIFSRELYATEKTSINTWLSNPSPPVPTLASLIGGAPSEALLNVLSTYSAIPAVGLLGVEPGTADSSATMQSIFNSRRAAEFAAYGNYTFQHQLTHPFTYIRGNQATINVSSSYLPIKSRTWNAVAYPEIDFVLRPADNGGGFVPMQNVVQMVIQDLALTNTSGKGTLAPNVVPDSQMAGFFPALYTTTSYGGRNPVAGGTHASFTLRECGANNFYFGFLLAIAQYDLVDDCRAGGCQVGFAVAPHYKDGGAIDFSIRSCIGYNNNIFVGLWHISTEAALAFNDTRIENCHSNTGATHYHFYSHWWRANNNNKHGNGGPNYLVRCASEYLLGDSGVEFSSQRSLYYPQYDPAPPAWAQSVTQSSANGNYLRVTYYPGVVVNEGTDLYVDEYVCNDSRPIVGIFRGGPYSRTFIRDSSGGGSFHQWLTRADHPTALFYFQGSLGSFGRANNVCSMPDSWTYWMDPHGAFSPFRYLHISGWIAENESVNHRSSISTAVIVTPRTPLMVPKFGLTFSADDTVIDTVGPFSGKTVRRIVTGASTGAYAVSYVQACLDGLGYQVNDVLTFVGGTFAMPAQVRVTAVNGVGAVTAVTLLNPGSYTATPTPNNGSGYLAASVTGGSGNGATVGYVLGGMNDATPRIESPFANNGGGLFADNGQQYAGTWGMIWVRTSNTAPPIVMMSDVNAGNGWMNAYYNCAHWQVMNPGEWTAFVVMRPYHNDDVKFGFVLPPNTASGFELRFSAFAALGKGGLDNQVLQHTMKQAAWNPIPYPNALSLTATGNNQAGAFALYARVNQFTTVPSGSGARLWPLSANDEITVVNRGGNTLAIYPPVGGRINALAINAALSLPAGQSVALICLDMLNFAGTSN